MIYGMINIPKKTNRHNNKKKIKVMHQTKPFIIGDQATRRKLNRDCG
jgi:hypothetical protein